MKADQTQTLQDLTQQQNTLLSIKLIPEAWNPFTTCLSSSMKILKAASRPAFAYFNVRFLRNYSSKSYSDLTWVY